MERILESDIMKGPALHTLWEDPLPVSNKISTVGRLELAIPLNLALLTLNLKRYKAAVGYGDLKVTYSFFSVVDPNPVGAWGKLVWT